MSKVCGWQTVYRPCRSKKRGWTPAAVGRAARKACEDGHSAAAIRAAVEEALQVCDLAESMPCEFYEGARGVVEFYRDAWTKPNALGRRWADSFSFRLARGTVDSYRAVAQWWNNAKPRGAEPVPEELPLSDAVDFLSGVMDGSITAMLDDAAFIRGCTDFRTGGGV